MEIIPLFLILLTVTAFFAQASSQSDDDRYDIEFFQPFFNREICGGCQGDTNGQDLCSQHRAILENLTKMNLGPRSIIQNQLNISYIKLLFKNTTGNYYISGRPFPNVTTGYVTAMPILHDNAQYRGHVSYFHPTVFDKQKVPSMMLADPQNLGQSYLSLVAFWCSRGYSVTFYDGIGLGINYALVHPYVVQPIPNVQNMYFCLNDTLKDLQGQYNISDLPKTIKLYAVGYSQGAAYALWQQVCLTQLCWLGEPTLSDRYSIQKVSGLQGAYDPLGTVYPFLVNNVTKEPTNNFSIQTRTLTTIAKPGLVSMALNSFATYYPSGPIPLLQFFNWSFFDMNCTNPKVQDSCDVLFRDTKTRAHMNISAAFLQKSLSELEFSLAFANTAFNKEINGKRYSSYLQAYLLNDGSNSIECFVIVSALATKNFNGTLELASLVRKTLVHPGNVLVWTLHYDSVVSPKNAEALKGSNKNINYFCFENSNYKVCDGKKSSVNVDHLRAQIVGNIYAYLFFNGTLPPSQCQ